MRGLLASNQERMGLTLLEVLVSSFILSILSVSLIHGLTALELESRMAKDRMAAAMLAADLREEILSKPSVDPGANAVLGLESGEKSAGRIEFDDQDDYRDLVDRPASDIGGTPLAGLSGIWRSVHVERVSAEDPAGSAIFASPTGLRRFTVTVYRHSTEIARLTWLGMGQGN